MENQENSYPNHITETGERISYEFRAYRNPEKPQPQSGHV